jgi:hypothetical protein
MKSFSKIGFAAIGLILLPSLAGNLQQAEARRAFAAGPNGAAGAYAFRGQYGGRIGAGAVGPNRGAGFRAGQVAGPNGGSLKAGGAFGYQRGLGAFHQSGWQGQGPNGASGSGYTKNRYNAQTGQGVRSSSEQVKTSSGADYGYKGTTDYTKGQGATSVIQTDNKGTYDVNWDKGQKPVVTPVSTQTQ